MQSLPWPAAAFVTAVVSAGAVTFAAAAPHLPARAAEWGWGLAEVAMFLLLAVLAELRRLPLGLHAVVSVGCAVNCAAAIVLGPEVATWISALAMGAGDVA